jgi:hypothetical protein
MQVFVKIHDHVAGIGDDPDNPVFEVLSGHHPLADQAGDG